jgi:hypothetical protein
VFSEDQTVPVRSFALPEWSLVQPFEQFPDRSIYFFQPEELVMT